MFSYCQTCKNTLPLHDGLYILAKAARAITSRCQVAAQSARLRTSTSLLNAVKGILKKWACFLEIVSQLSTTAKHKVKR